MSLRDIDLDRPLLKVTEDSERSVAPAATYQTAMRALARKGIAPDFQARNFCRSLLERRLRCELSFAFPEFDYELRVGGKGPSRAQSLASAAMELVERYSLHRANVFARTEFDCMDLRDGSILKLGPILEMRNTKCVAAGQQLRGSNSALPARAPRVQLPGRASGGRPRSCLWKRSFPTTLNWSRSRFSLSCHLSTREASITSPPSCTHLTGLSMSPPTGWFGMDNG